MDVLQRGRYKITQKPLSGHQMCEQGDGRGQQAFRIDDKGVPQDYAKAIDWYTKSAEQGDTVPQNESWCDI